MRAQARQMITDKNLEVLDAWVERSGKKSERGELADSCGKLVYSMAEDMASIHDDVLYERMVFCQDITVARVDVSADEYRRLKRICTEQNDTFYQTLCKEAEFY